MSTRRSSIRGSRSSNSGSSTRRTTNRGSSLGGNSLIGSSTRVEVLVGVQKMGALPGGVQIGGQYQRGSIRGSIIWVCSINGSSIVERSNKRSKIGWLLPGGEEVFI